MRIPQCYGMRILLDIQNLQLSHNNFYISINDLNLEKDVWYIETPINLYFNFCLFYCCKNAKLHECFLFSTMSRVV